MPIMLRISAVLAILIGLFFAYETYTGMSMAYQYGQGEEAYLTAHFALQWVFVVALIGGGSLAIWLSTRVLLAAAWGIVLGLNAPHLIRPAIPVGMIKQTVLAHGGNAYVIGVDPRLYVIAGAAVLGIVLAGVSEWNRAKVPA